jgi:hypothetical protein
MGIEMGSELCLNRRMKTVAWCFALVLLVGCCTSSSFGQVEVLKDGNALLRACQHLAPEVTRQEDVVPSINCMAYFDGVMKGYAYMREDSCVCPMNPQI